MNVLLSAKNLVKIYGKDESSTKALDDVSLDVYDGEFLVILGSSGSGKSTLLNSISGIDDVNSGEILVDGKDITKFKEDELTDYRANFIGYVSQTFNLINDISVLSNIVVSPSSNKDLNKIQEILEKLKISNKLYKFPFELSGGEQQRVSIARALNKKNSILLFDEPTGSLDYATGKEVLKIIEDIHNNEHKTIVLVTHTKEIAKMADRVIVMKSGKIISETKNTEKVSVSEIDW